MRRLIQASAVAIIFFGVTARGARADLTINLGNITLGAGNTATMDITATSSSGFTLQGFGLELLITSVGSPMTQLQFASPQPDPGFIYSNSSYVFAGQSFNAVNGDLPFWNLPTPDYAPVDILGGDAVSSIYDTLPGYVTISARVYGVSRHGAILCAGRNAVESVSGFPGKRSQHVFR